MSYLITPSQDSIIRGLESWQWLPIRDKHPILVTAFADIFFNASDGVWFLDTLEGNFKRVFASRAQLEQALSTEEGQDMYLLSPFIDRSLKEGKALDEKQCFDFILHPIVGGAVDYSNIERRDFVVALNLRGQLHEQVRHFPPGTKISKFILADEKMKKPWWKFW